MCPLHLLETENAQIRFSRFATASNATVLIDNTSTIHPDICHGEA
jgi:hypothetical protein